MTAGSWVSGAEPQKLMISFAHITHAEDITTVATITNKIATNRI